jgi:Holliday junction resolvase RusA-like endonuclease
MHQTFVIQANPNSWNVLIGQHHRVYMEVRDFWKQLTSQALRKFKIKPVQKFPCTLVVHCRFPTDQRRDIDSLYAKAIVDTLVKEKILPDDNLKYLNRVMYSGELGTGKDVEIQLRLIEED